MYHGVLGNIAFKENLQKPVYFEVQFHFDVKLEDITFADTLFEFGLTPRNLIDKHKVLKYHSDAIIVTISRCTKKLRLCMMFWQEGKSYKLYSYLKQYNMEKRTSSETYKNFLYQFGLKIDPHQHKMSVYWIGQEKEHMHDFLNVSFSRTLYPVFGVTDKVFVRMKFQSNSVVTRRRSNFCG